MAYQDDCKLPRRKFLQALVATPIALGMIDEDSKASLENKNTSRVPMLQVWADNSSSLVVVMGEPGWEFSAYSNPNLKVSLIKIDSLSGSGRVLYRLQVDGLSTASYSQIAVYDQRKKLIDVRSLKGLDLDLKLPKIAVISCANYRNLNSQWQMYSRLEEERPDLNLLIGDMVYSNSRASSVFGTPEVPGTALGRYVETWNLVNLYRLDPLIPSISVWDDHDYGTNNGDGSHPYKNEMKVIFRTFYPMPEYHARLSYGPGVAFRLRAFGLDLHMLDGRSFRENKNTQWGSQQESWFVQDFAASKNPAWIINGTQFFKYFFLSESVEKSATPSLRMLKKLLKSSGKPAALFSGDVHSSQVQELSEDIFGFKTFEVTSSAIHSSSVGNMMKRRTEEGQLFYYGKSNFILVNSELKNSTTMELSLSCATEAGTYPIATTPFRIQAA